MSILSALEVTRVNSLAAASFSISRENSTLYASLLSKVRVQFLAGECDIAPVKQSTPSRAGEMQGRVWGGQGGSGRLLTLMSGRFSVYTQSTWTDIELWVCCFVLFLGSGIDIRRGLGYRESSTLDRTGRVVGVGVGGV